MRHFPHCFETELCFDSGPTWLVCSCCGIESPRTCGRSHKDFLPELRDRLWRASGRRYRDGKDFLGACFAQASPSTILSSRAGLAAVLLRILSLNSLERRCLWWWHRSGRLRRWRMCFAWCFESIWNHHLSIRMWKVKAGWNRSYQLLSSKQHGVKTRRFCLYMQTTNCSLPQCSSPRSLPLTPHGCPPFPAPGCSAHTASHTPHLFANMKAEAACISADSVRSPCNSKSQGSRPSSYSSTATLPNSSEAHTEPHSDYRIPLLEHWDSNQLERCLLQRSVRSFSRDWLACASKSQTTQILGLSCSQAWPRQRR